MAALDLEPFPVVRLHPVANSANAWVALGIEAVSELPLQHTLAALFGTPDLLAAIAPLDCVLPLADPFDLDPQLLALMPPQRVVLKVDADALALAGRAQRLDELQERGYHVIVDGPPPAGAARPDTPRAWALDCADGVPPGMRLSPQLGPHLARKVDSMASFAACERAGFTWFSGDYALDTAGAGKEPDGPSRRRVLGLLALLARDADSRELEQLLKQDPVLSFHLLKLVNSAAFAVNTQITGYAQAIALLGRRQLQRWLQLLLYARAATDGPPNLLLPLAALRAGQLELLCKLDGGERDEQDLAFMTGAFSLLDRLLGMPMDAILADLALPPHVASALLWREGELGRRLAMAERGPDAAQLAQAGIDTRRWWASLLHAYHWAIQVGSNV